MKDAPALLAVSNFGLALATAGGAGHVLDAVDFEVARGEIAGLVGESGCGKSTLVRAILGLAPAGARVLSGDIRFDGENLLAIDERQLAARILARRIGYIPQDPFLSFNPLFRVGAQMLEIMRWRAPTAMGGRAAHRARLIELMERVRIPSPAAALNRFPHEFSGGQLQRLMIVAALSCAPDLVLADEPTSALDVTTQQQVLLLLETLARESGVAVVLVTHDLGLVAQYCDRVTVMYAGQTIETLPREDILAGARHPYTRRLLDCHPDRGGALVGIPGIVPPITHMPGGCRFHPRCDEARAACAAARPEVTRLSAVHVARCLAVAEAAREAAHG